MKKFIAGVAVGALIFGAVPVFADSIKSLVGVKVTGVYTVEQDGKKIADGAVLNGSAYVPVRAIANATGTSLTVEGKKITLESQKESTGDDGVPSPENLDRRNQIIRLENDIISKKNWIEVEKAYIQTNEKGIDEQEAREEPVPGQIDGLKRNIEESRKKIAQYEKEIADIEAEIALIQAEIDASK